MVRKILQIGEPILTKKTEAVVDPTSKEIQKLIDDLIDTCLINADYTAGISAPQVGVGKSVCICRRIDLEEIHGEGNVSDEELWHPMINPKITLESEAISTFWEGCLSIGEGDDQLFGPVDRPFEVTVDYIDRTGKPQMLTGEGFFSHVLQHEIDHLNGVLFITYVEDPNQLWKNKDFDDYIRKHGEFPPIS